MYVKTAKNFYYDWIVVLKIKVTSLQNLRFFLVILLNFEHQSQTTKIQEILTSRRLMLTFKVR